MQGQTEEQRMKLIRSIAAGVMYRVQQYLNDIGQQELFCAAPELSDAIEEMDVEALDLLEQEEKRADGSYYRLITLLGGTPAGQTLLDLYQERVPLYEKYADFTISCHGKELRNLVDEICEKVIISPDKSK